MEDWLEWPIKYSMYSLKNNVGKWHGEKNCYWLLDKIHYWENNKIKFVHKDQNIGRDKWKLCLIFKIKSSENCTAWLAVQAVTQVLGISYNPKENHTDVKNWQILKDIYEKHICLV